MHSLTNTGTRAIEISEAKQRLPLPELLNRLGLGDHAKKSARCFLHDDHHNSFSVWQTTAGLVLQMSCRLRRDEISFLSLYEKLPPGEAIKRYFDLAGLNGGSSVHPAEPFDWMTCVQAFTDGDLERLSDWRGLSGQFCSWLRKQALVGSYHDRIAFSVHDDAGKIIGAHVRQDGRSWFYTPTGTKARPLVIGSTNNGAVHIFESQWDAFSYMDALGERDGVIIARGNQNGSRGKNHLNGSSLVYLWIQNDRPGEKWQEDICAIAIANIAVKRVQIPRQHKDLNLWRQGERALSDELRAAIANADTIKQAERSWFDALDEGVVTARELHCVCHDTLPWLISFSLDPMFLRLFRAGFGPIDTTIFRSTPGSWYRQSDCWIGCDASRRYEGLSGELRGLSW